MARFSCPRCAYETNYLPERCGCGTFGEQFFDIEGLSQAGTVLIKKDPPEDLKSILEKLVKELQSKGTIKK